MPITKPPVLPIWADAGDKVQPTNAEIQVGWPLSATPPSRQRFNWLLNFTANAVRYFSRRGLPDYDAAETYMIGDRVIGDDGSTYRSKIDNNTGNTPSTSPTQWERWGYSAAELDAFINGKQAAFIVRAASTAAINLASPGAAIDGVTMVAGDRFLEKDNGTGANRGIYIWNGAAVAATRAPEADTGAELKSGIIIEVTEGVANADTLWTLVTDGAIVIGTTSLSFARKDVSVSNVQGTFRNLLFSAPGTSALITASFDELVLGDGAGAYVVERNVAGTINTTTTGAGGLDAGAIAASTAYHIFRIGKTDGTRAWLFSLSATAPTMPAGYTFKARVGWFKTDGTVNKYPLSFRQTDRKWMYVVASGSNVTGLPISASGSQGNYSTPTWAQVSLAGYIASTATEVAITLVVGASSTAMVAPNNSYGAFNSTSNPPPLMASDNAGIQHNIPAEIGLETTSIYFAAGGTTSEIAVRGFNLAI